LATPVAEPSVRFVARQKPQTHGDLCGVKELAWESDQAVNEVGLDNATPDGVFYLILLPSYFLRNKNGRPS
jgi:hypothetical protein